MRECLLMSACVCRYGYDVRGIGSSAGHANTFVYVYDQYVKCICSLLERYAYAMCVLMCLYVHMRVAWQ